MQVERAKPTQLAPGKTRSAEFRPGVWTVTSSQSRRGSAMRTTVTR
jgi:hypothetical protein